MRMISLDGLAVQRRSLLLAPSSVAPGPFNKVIVDSARHSSRLAEAQKLRGRIALHEGAVDRTQLSADGRHVQPADRHSWHLLTLDAGGRVAACMRYLPHRKGVGYNDLAISQSTLAQSKAWGHELRTAVEEDLFHARQRNYW